MIILESTVWKGDVVVTLVGCRGIDTGVVGIKNVWTCFETESFFDQRTVLVLLEVEVGSNRYRLVFDAHVSIYDFSQLSG